MSTTPPPINPDEHEQPSLFEEFINRSLDLDGLGDAPAPPGAATQHEPEDAPDDESDLPFGQRMLFQVQLPNGGPILTGAFGATAPGVTGARIPSLPMAEDARWRAMRLVGRPTRLRIQQPRFNYMTHAGQLVLTLGARAARRLEIIPNVRPGWTAVRYRTGRGTLGEYIEWRGNKASMHHLKLDEKDITGFIRNEDMPETRPARALTLTDPALTGLWMALEIALLVIAAAWLASQLAFGGQPTPGELQARIAALEAQISALEAPAGSGSTVGP